MNNLKAAREEMGLTQKDLAAIVQRVDPRIDAGMISRFETEWCLPTPIVASSLASALQTSETDLFGPEGQFYIATITAPETPVEPLPFELEDLINALDTKPKTRRQLCEELDVNDRNLRKLIRQARDYGYVIMYSRRGGYYLSTEIDDMVVFYKREYGRAMSILEGLRRLRQYLKNLGVTI